MGHGKMNPGRHGARRDVAFVWGLDAICELEQKYGGQTQGPTQP